MLFENSCSRLFFSALEHCCCNCSKSSTGFGTSTLSLKKRGCVFVLVPLCLFTQIHWVMAFYLFFCVCTSVSPSCTHVSLSVHLSISPPVCRNIAKQTFLETLQDNFIEMDILATARRDGAYTDGYVA